MIWQKRGFTLVELVAVLIVVSVLAVSVASKFGQSEQWKLNTGRDSIVAAVFSAQQLAMAQDVDTRLVSGGNQIDVQQDTGSGWASISIGGVQYPMTLTSGQAVSAATFPFDRLGHTTSGSITLSQGLQSLTVSVAESGFTQ